MTEMLGTIFITAVIAFFPGLMIGYVLARKNQQALLQKEYDRAKEEFDCERVELSEDLGKQLSKIRQSIIQSVQAYESAAKTVEEKCLKNIKNHPALASLQEPQRQIDFFSNAVEDHAFNEKKPAHKNQFTMPFESAPEEETENKSSDQESADDKKFNGYNLEGSPDIPSSSNEKQSLKENMSESDMNDDLVRPETTEESELQNDEEKIARRAGGI